MKTPITFRKDRTGEISAIFLNEAATLRLDFGCYVHFGQHGHASPNWVYGETRPAKPEEYQSLLAELESIYGKGQLAISGRLPSFAKTMALFRAELEKLERGAE